MSDALVHLPTTSDPSAWSEDEKALLVAAGLVAKKGNRLEPAPRSTVVAFLNHCARTGLDPIAKQIYAIERGGKWNIQISIDGARLIAQRSGQYAGQTPVEWTADGREWVEVWLSDEPPAAARVGVLRRGFEAPLFAVARWSSYAVMVPEYENGRPTGGMKLSPMWERMPDLMLGKVAEMLALRKAFPLELSGLHTAEEVEFELAADEPRRRAAAGPVLEPGLRSAQRDPLPEPEPVSGPVEGEPVSASVGDVEGPDSGDGSPVEGVPAWLFEGEDEAKEGAS